MGNRTCARGALGAWSCSLAAHVFVLAAFAWHIPAMIEPPALAGTANALNIETAAESLEEAFAERPEIVVEQVQPRELSAAATTAARRTAEAPRLPVESARLDFPPKTAFSPDSAAAHRVASPPPTMAARVPPPLPRRPLVTAAALAMAGAATPESPGNDATHPEPLRNDLPPYPATAVLSGWEGTVVLRLEITAAGDVARLAVADSSGYAILDEAASSAVKHWRFCPARRDRQVVAGSVLLPIVFELPSRWRVSVSSTRLSN
jgi:periplasmic protein TonB